MAYIKTIIALLLSLFQILSPIGSVLFAGGEDAFFTPWSSEETYGGQDYIVTIEKDPSKDFVILNLADVQLDKWEAYNDNGAMAKDTMDQLIAETHPDLITLSGDNAWSTSTYLKLVKDLDSFGIPWAPVMGNHDGQSTISEFWCAKLMDNAENCLWCFGPENMGYGNYVINITENGNIIHTLFMLDTHSGIDDDNNPNGAKNSGYDNLWNNQMEWYTWCVEGIAAEAGRVVESTCIFHIPLVEFKDAWLEAWDDDNDCYKSEYSTAFGEDHEPHCCAPDNNGFFDLCKSLGSTKNIIVGHDHVNSASIEWEGIRLTYSLKCGPACYWEPEMCGGTTITIGSDGCASVAHHYITPSASNSQSVC